jgi:hypothetical protein
MRVAVGGDGEDVAGVDEKLVAAICGTNRADHQIRTLLVRIVWMMSTSAGVQA